MVKVWLSHSISNAMIQHVLERLVLGATRPFKWGWHGKERPEERDTSSKAHQQLHIEPRCLPIALAGSPLSPAMHLHGLLQSSASPRFVAGVAVWRLASCLSAHHGGTAPPDFDAPCLLALYSAVLPCQMQKLTSTIYAHSCCSDAAREVKSDAPCKNWPPKDLASGKP